MIVHIVLLRPREDLSDGERREFEEAAASLAQVPGVISMSCGPDFSGRGKGFTYGAVLYLPDREALAAYQSDPQHRTVVGIFDRLTSDKLVVDYETDRSGISA
jgi:hypothetical protein